MFVRVVISLFLVVVASAAFAQKDEDRKAGKASSFKKFSSRSAGESSKELLDDADQLKNEKPSEALDKVEEALAVSVTEKDEFGQARSYLLLGEINEKIAEWKLARENYVRSRTILLSAYSATSEYKRVLAGLLRADLQLELFDDALSTVTEALSLRLSTAERREWELQLSEVYYKMGNYGEAQKVLDNVDDDAKKSDKVLDTRYQSQQAKISARNNDLEKTKQAYDNSLNTVRSKPATDVQSEAAIQDSKEEIADVLREQKRYDDEIALRNQSIEYNLERNNLAEVSRDKVEIGKTLEAKGENKAALKEIEEAVIIADTLDRPEDQATAYLSLAGLYEKNGRTPQALSAYKKYSDAVSRVQSRQQAQLDERGNILKKQREIEELSNDIYLGQQEERIQEATLFRQQLIIYGLTFLILVTATTTYFIYRNARASKRANQMLALKSLRSQMNPHFIFNALNSVNQFIAQQDERSANKFLSEFSQLMRLVLEYSQEDFISLKKEHEILTLYLKLEHYRFRDKFDYEFTIDEGINTETIAVPPMLIQPYIENAVWHGLRYKETKGKLLVHIGRQDHKLLVEVTDDGIGRKKSAELKTQNQKKHQSTGLRNIEERLAIINTVYNASYEVAVSDAGDGTGTRVTVTLPIRELIEAS